MSPETATPERVYQPVNFAAKLALIHDHWQPRVVAEMNDYQFKIVKILGDFVWHDHAGTDETFIVLEGVLRIDDPPGHRGRAVGRRQRRRSRHNSDLVRTRCSRCGCSCA